MAYRILTGDTSDDLEEAVDRAVADGWSLVGGVAVTCYEFTNPRKGYTEVEWNWAQAVTKEEVVV